MTLLIIQPTFLLKLSSVGSLLEAKVCQTEVLAALETQEHERLRLCQLSPPTRVPVHKLLVSCVHPLMHIDLLPDNQAGTNQNRRSLDAERSAVLGVHSDPITNSR